MRMLKMMLTILLVLLFQSIDARDLNHRHANEDILLQGLEDSRKDLNQFFMLTDKISQDSAKSTKDDAIKTAGKENKHEDKSGEGEDEVQVETVQEHSEHKADHDSGDKFENFDENENFDHHFMDRSDAPDHVPGIVLPISHRKETLQDIYVREKLPEIQKILASGDQEAIARIIAESEDDPFTVLPNNLKYSQLLAADLFFSFLTKMVTWFVLISLLLPALVPLFTILSLGAELAALWLIPDLSEDA